MAFHGRDLQDERALPVAYFLPYLGSRDLPREQGRHQRAGRRKLGIRAGDKIRITSRSCALGIVAAAEPSTLVRPGCVAISLHYGHWQMGASSLSIRDAGHAVMGGPVRADRKMGTGVSFNRLGRLDVSMGGTPLVDCVGGIPDFSSTRVKITKA